MKHLPSDFRWSFSKLASFLQCPYSFYLSYIKNDKPDEIENYFSQYGSFAHKLLELWAKDELPAFCLAEEWRDGYEEAVTMPPPPFPKGMADKYYNAAMDYFDHFEGFGDEWEVLSAEKKFVIRLGQYNVSGIADLVLKNKNTGELWVIDHKSKSMNSMKKEHALYRRQLYLYAMWCKEEFGEYPTKISFNMFKEGVFIDEDFSLDLLEETKKWFIDTIHEIENLDVIEVWETKLNSYFCGQICGVAPECDDYQQLRQEELDRYYAKKQLEAEMMGGVV